MAHDLHVGWARRFRKEDGMKVVRTGTRVSAFASLLLVGACMAGGNTADKAELGVNPADGTSGGGGGGGGGGGVGSGNINARFAVTKLTADQAGVALNTDPQLQDVWGVTSLQDQFFAVAQATGQVIGLAPGGEPTMHIPLIEETAPAGTAADMTPTGIAVLSEEDNLLMDIAGDCRAASLLVAAQSGRLWAVNPDISQDKAFVVADRSAWGAQYTGVVVLPPETATTTGGDDGHGGGGTPPPAPTARVLAVDFHNGRVDQFNVVDGILKYVANPTKQFAISNLPTNFAPFGIFATSDRVILTAAERRTNGVGEPHIDQQTPGDGKGIVAAFDLTGKQLWRTQSDMFNIPWGMAMGDLRLCATSALLVGQHGDATKVDGANNKFGGTIIAMDLRTGKVIQPLLATDTQPVRVQGLWGLTFATGITNIQETRLHLGAGPVEPDGNKPEIEHGLFARLEMTSL
jgi:uncharacterized protein (TIGR03118 family)